jgi:hypothetical protein
MKPPRPTRSTRLEMVSPYTRPQQRSQITDNPVGEPDSHAKAKEFLAGAIGAFVDREVETRGLDFIDKEEAKRHGERHAEEQLRQNSNW